MCASSQLIPGGTVTEDLAAIEAAAPPQPVAGTRYDATGLTFVDN
ncbi:hypothetical protein [Streptomyces sp. Tu 2975]|nr:hypothetical protein [Streptomyces sp. Tu 2975]